MATIIDDPVGNNPNVRSLANFVKTLGMRVSCSVDEPAKVGYNIAIGNE